jgi:predicted transglutaminase-like cysteine proteinase|tara:strand:+ start:3607 stop:4275 length:669 start_codon:yes stop_codon:yes gene_type:complete
MVVISRRNFILGCLAGGVGGYIPAALADPSNPPHEEPSYFGSTELRSEKLSLFPKWRDVLSRFVKERMKVKGCTGDCDYATWQAFLKTVKDLDPMTQLDRVNREMNKKPYIIDPINWGVPDYWATPFEFFLKSGDCEDYAIIKYISLRSLGWAADTMRLVVLEDQNLEIMHAVLVVFYQDVTYVLDNQIRSVIPADRIRHYRPVYSINEKAWWKHKFPNRNS